MTVQTPNPTVESIKTDTPPENTAGEAVLNQTRDFLSRFLAMPSQAAMDVLTLWIAHTHVVDGGERLAFTTTPRLALLSDEPECGKTAVLDMISNLGHKPKMLIDPTPAGYAQLISESKSTVMIDEIDILFGAGNSKSVLRSLLNSGYKVGGTFMRAGNKGEISIFAPLALGGMSAKFDSHESLKALKSRSICIRMKQARPNEVYRMREHDGIARKMQQDLAKWIHRNTSKILTDWPEMPKGIEGRKREIFEPLMMVANVAGGHWPETAAQACKELALGENELKPEVPLSARILLDLKRIFGNSKQMSTENIINALYGLENGPWLEMWPHSGTAPVELSALVTPLGVGPVKIWDATEKRSVQGYKRDMLALLWSNIPDAVGEENLPADWEDVT